MRISDWSSDVCSSYLGNAHAAQCHAVGALDRADHVADRIGQIGDRLEAGGDSLDPIRIEPQAIEHRVAQPLVAAARHILAVGGDDRGQGGTQRSEEHTSELQSLMRISYAVFCLKKKKHKKTLNTKAAYKETHNKDQTENEYNKHHNYT